jgi:4-hydroxy-3-polyprenylbenzoate decarboxylase
MVWKDFRSFVEEIERRGNVRVVEGADPHLEMGALTELMCERMGPMLVFESIKGFPRDYRIAAKPYSTPLRSAIAMGLPEQVSEFEMFKAWRDKLHGYRPVDPVRVNWSPVMENVDEDADVNLKKFPVPHWHEQDGGPYFGTGCAVITRGPDEDWVNLGTYRCMLHDERTTAVDIAPYHHGNLHMQKWWAAGKHAPVAVAVSLDPALFLAAAEGLPWGSTEYEYAGYLRGMPEEVFAGPRTGLPLPANAELIIEGEVPPPSEDERVEGPFGEYTGYYAGGRKERPVIRVQAVYYRSNPLLHGDPPLKPPVLTIACPPARSVLSIWDGLEKAGLPGIKGVYPLNAGGEFITVVAVTQQYAGHARQVGRVASGLIHSMCRMVIVVDDDIDPSNAQEVLWAIASRSDPATTFEIQTDCPASPLDPRIPPALKGQRSLTNSRALVIACRPWEWRDQFPPVNRNSEELRQRTLDKWSGLFQDTAPSHRSAKLPELAATGGPA